MDYDARFSDLAGDQRRRQRMLRGLGLDPQHAVYRAMAQLPRHHFVDDLSRTQAYDNTPLPIACGQTISQPELIARMLELLQVAPGMHVLDVGCGSGYAAALLAHCVGPQGSVHSVEVHGPLIEQARGPLGHHASAIAPLVLHQAGEALGWPAAAPYQRIHVACAAPGVIPQALIEQLDCGGRMVIPVADGSTHTLYVLWREDDGSIQQQAVEEVLFVPMRVPASGPRG